MSDEKETERFILEFAYSLPSTIAYIESYVEGKAIVKRDGVNPVSQAEPVGVIKNHSYTTEGTKVLLEAELNKEYPENITLAPVLLEDENGQEITEFQLQVKEQ